LDLTVIIITVVYIGFIFAIGVMTSKGVHNSDDFLVAGRDVRWFFLACTIGATVVGGGYAIGAVGETYELGLLMLFAAMGGYMQFIFAGFVVAPKFRNAEVYTVAGYMDHRFGDGPRVVSLVLSLLFSLFVIAAQMAAIGHVLAAMFPELAEGQTLIKLAVIVGGVIVIIYSAAGGLKAVILTDVFQFLVLLVGFMITAALVLPEVSLSFDASLGKLPAKFFDPTREKSWLYLVGLFLTFLLGETFAPGYVTRFCAGKSKRDLQIGIGGVGIFLTLFMPVVVFLIAVYARLHFPDVPKGRAMPLVIEHLNHPIVAGLIIAALLSAVMSSADSALNSATAIFIKDILEKYFKDEKKHTDRKILRLSRILTISLGVAAIAVAVVLPDIIDQLLLAYVVWAPGMILPIVIGSVTKMRGRVMINNLTIGMIAGPLTALIHKWIDYATLASEMTGSGRRFVEVFGDIAPAVLGVFSSVIVFLIAQVATKNFGRFGKHGQDEETL
jgi:SSS family solute:Na+ symporter